MKLYDYPASANCYKVRLLLAQLGRPYDRVEVDIFAGETLTEEYAAKNPARATPVLELDEGALLTESNAILFYLAQGTRFLPPSSLAPAQVVRWRRCSRLRPALGQLASSCGRRGLQVHGWTTF